jgi:hypothetical protein
MCSGMNEYDHTHTGRSDTVVVRWRQDTDVECLEALAATKSNKIFQGRQPRQGLKSSSHTLTRLSAQERFIGNTSRHAPRTQEAMHFNINMPSSSSFIHIP